MPLSNARLVGTRTYVYAVTSIEPPISLTVETMGFSIEVYESASVLSDQRSVPARLRMSPLIAEPASATNMAVTTHRNFNFHSNRSHSHANAHKGMIAVLRRPRNSWIIA